jgi:hypothetical protein
LNEKFPNRKSEIDQLLKAYPADSNYRFFWDKLYLIDSAKTAANRSNSLDQKAEVVKERPFEKTGEIFVQLMNQLVQQIPFEQMPEKQEYINILLRRFPAECSYMFFWNKLNQDAVFNQLVENFPHKKSQIRKLLSLYPENTSFRFFKKKLNQENENQSSVSNENQKSERSTEKTIKLLYQLIEKVPGKRREIEKLLGLYPTEVNLNFFITKLSQDESSIKPMSSSELLKTASSIPRLENDKKQKAIIRTVEQTFKLFNQLDQMFPNRKGEIEQLLSKYPTECNNNFYWSKLTENQAVGSSKQVDKKTAVSNYKPEKPPIRSAEQTVKLFNQLYGKFPNKKVQIEKLLRTCPAGCNLKFFVAKLDQEDEEALKKPSDSNRATVASASNSKKFRSVVQSGLLYVELNDKFPNKEGVILKLLDNNPSEMNVDFFLNKLKQEALSSSSNQSKANMTPKASSMERSDEKTFKLFNQLIEKYPKKERDILKLLCLYPCECNQTFFWTLLN